MIAPRITPLLIGLALGCGRAPSPVAAPPPAPARSEAPPAREEPPAQGALRGSPPAGTQCPDRMEFVPDPGGPVVLGAPPEKLGGYDGSGIPEHPRTPTHAAGGFCIDEAHFPGRGYPWPNGENGGSSQRLAETLRDGLPALNRRLCTYGEKLYATAGPQNWWFGHSPADPAGAECEYETRTRNGGAPKRPIGGYTDCTTKHSSWTLYDIDARATWLTRDARTREVMTAWWGEELDASPNVLMLNAALSGLALGPGGSDWVPTTAGYHCHAADCGLNDTDGPDTLYVDDGFVFCADPHSLDPAIEARFAQAREAVARTGRYATLLEFL